MGRRSKTSQSAHDRAVKQIADRYANQGYDVDADISGYPQPKAFGGYRPDVVAKRGHERHIVEVETSESIDSARDRGQQREFEKVANRSKNTSFDRYVVKTKK